MNCSLRVTTLGPELAHVSVRRQQFVVGRPIEFDDASPRIAALEYPRGVEAWLPGRTTGFRALTFAVEAERFFDSPMA